jgi:transposase
METTRKKTNLDTCLWPDYDQLREENTQLREENRILKVRVETLTNRVAQLETRLEAQQREGKRQAAPFRKKDQPAANPKKPGRKKGKRHGQHAHRDPPPRIDETYDVPLPPKCPHCGGKHLSESHVASQYQTEIPRNVIFRRFDVHVGTCCDCHHTVAGRHALQTSSARGAAASQFGPNVHALLAVMNKECGLSHGKCVNLLGTLFEDLHMARATSVRSIERTAERCQPAYEQIRQDVRRSSQVTPDETGWRVGGRNAWLHAFATPRETCYVIDPTRSHLPAEQLLGLDWNGTLVHDGWSVYDCFTQAFHQQCLGHLQRRCEKLLETAVGGAVHLPREVLELIGRGYALRRAWRGHRLCADDMAAEGLELSCELERLAHGSFCYEPNRRLADHLLVHAMNWFWFLVDPTIDATNYRGEQAIRPAVVNRKVWGGNRTWPGAHAQSILTSVLRTCHQRLTSVFDFLQQALCLPPPQLLLPA